MIQARTNSGTVAADLAGQAVQVRAAVAAVVTMFGAQLLTGVKRRAALPRSGPPGPRLITGNYNRSINRRTTHTTTRSVATVGTNAPQGRRLEYGFTGTDSAGRSYNQPAYPHFGPALDEITEPFHRAIAEATKP